MKDFEQRPVIEGGTAMQIAMDLAWLNEFCFEVTVELNGHRGSHYTVQMEVEEGTVGDDEWTGPEAKAQALGDNRMIQVQVYPCGSVSSYSIAGVDLGTCLASAVEHALIELRRWRDNGMVPQQLEGRPC